MPKRVIDADAMWQSDKLACCRQKSIPEYPWLYGFADANGTFEIGNLRALHGRAYQPIRPYFSLADLADVLEDFKTHGLLYTWTENGKCYGHWTGSDVAGRLPPQSQRSHYPTLKVHQPTQTEIDAYYASIASTNGNGRLFPLPELPLPTADELRAEAEAKLVSQEKIRLTTEEGQYRLERWHKFWDRYPNKLDEDGTRKFWDTIPLLDLDTILERLEVWIVSDQWKIERYVPKSLNFLEKQYWKSKPGKGGTGGRGPGQKTTEEHIERFKRNAKIFGLDRP